MRDMNRREKYYAAKAYLMAKLCRATRGCLTQYSLGTLAFNPETKSLIVHNGGEMKVKNNYLAECLGRSHEIEAVALLDEEGILEGVTLWYSYGKTRNTESYYRDLHCREFAVLANPALRGEIKTGYMKGEVQ